jgi:hypothetical protein
MVPARMVPLRGLRIGEVDREVPVNCLRGVPAVCGGSTR